MKNEKDLKGFDNEKMSVLWSLFIVITGTVIMEGIASATLPRLIGSGSSDQPVIIQPLPNKDGNKRVVATRNTAEANRTASISSFAGNTTPFLPGVTFQRETLVTRTFRYDGGLIIGFTVSSRSNDGRIVTEDHAYSYEDIIRNGQIVGNRLKTDTVLRTIQVEGENDGSIVSTTREKTVSTNTYDDANGGRLSETHELTTQGFDGSGAILRDVRERTLRFDDKNRRKVTQRQGQVRTENGMTSVDETVEITYYDEAVPGRRSDAEFLRKITNNATGDVSFETVVETTAFQAALRNANQDGAITAEEFEQAVRSTAIGIQYQNGLPQIVMTISRSLSPGRDDSYLYTIQTAITVYRLNGNVTQVTEGTITFGSDGTVLPPLSSGNVTFPNTPTVDPSTGTVTIPLISNEQVIGGYVDITIQNGSAQVTRSVVWEAGSNGITVVLPPDADMPRGSTVTITLQIRDHNNQPINGLTRSYTVTIPPSASTATFTNRSDGDTNVAAAPGLLWANNVFTNQNVAGSFFNSVSGVHGSSAALVNTHNYSDTHPLGVALQKFFGAYNAIQNRNGWGTLTAGDINQYVTAAEGYASTLDSYGFNAEAGRVRAAINNYRTSAIVMVQ